MAERQAPGVKRGKRQLAASSARALKRGSRGKPRRARARGSRQAARPHVDDATGRTRDWRGRPPAADGKPRAVAAWIAAEVLDQERRYREIVREMAALDERRTRWVRDFYRRIQDTGFYVHADIKRRIPPEAIPPLPKRVRVVW